MWATIKTRSVAAAHSHVVFCSSGWSLLTFSGQFWHFHTEGLACLRSPWKQNMTSPTPRHLQPSWKQKKDQLIKNHFKIPTSIVPKCSINLHNPDWVKKKPCCIHSFFKGSTCCPFTTLRANSTSSNLISQTFQNIAGALWNIPPGKMRFDVVICSEKRKPNQTNQRWQRQSNRKNVNKANRIQMLQFRFWFI